VSPASVASVGSAVAPPRTPSAVLACDHAPPADFARDVQPILARRCFSCHTGDGVAADEHDFSKPEGVRAAHRQIADEVSVGAMPPKAPLPPAEADTLLRWAGCLEASR
jgi:hypothetical protein